MKLNDKFNPNALLIACLVCLVGVFGCNKVNSPNYPVEYNVANISGYSIKVIFNGLLDRWGGGGYSAKVNDSVVYLMPGEQKTLFIATWGRGKTNPETGPSIEGMQTLRVYRSDSIQSVANFMETHYWTFNQKPDYRGELLLQVSNAAFNP